MTQRRTGFYLAGEFQKDKQSHCMILSQSDKPFEIDTVEGEVTGRVFMTIRGKSLCNFVADRWFFFEGHRIGDIDKDKQLRQEINEVWKSWCKEFKRKYSPIMKTEKGDE